MIYRSCLRSLLAWVVVAGAATSAIAAVTDVSQSPLQVSSPDTIKTNLLFVLDDSGSMGFDFLPDHVNSNLCRSTGATSTNSGNFGNACCIGGNSSSACWLGDAPFGTTRGQVPFLAAGFNGVAYDPAVYYRPPVKADGSYWASQTRSVTSGWVSVKNDAYNIQNTTSIDLTTQYPDTEWCVDATFTDCLRNDNYVLPGTVNGKAYTVFHAVSATGTGSVATGAPDAATIASRTFGPHYYTIVAAEYCNSIDLRDCQGASGGTYTIPAPVRWCKSDADSRATTPAVAACQATRNGTFSFARFPTKFFSAGTAGSAEVRAKTTFTISSANLSCNVTVSAVTVGGVNLMAASTTASNNRNTLGTQIAAQINAKTSTGYTATTTNSGRTVTITAPAGLNTTATLSVTRAPTNCGFTLDNNSPAFSGYAVAVAPVPGTYVGSFQRVDIVSTRTTYPRAASRVDCTTVAGTCSYDEEMTNFANWWTYYHTRMQSMKSSAGLAFGAIGNNRRVGYLSINNNTGKDFLNLDVFEDTSTKTQKTSWFNKLVAAKPGSSTPLRTALSTAGKLYAGKYNSSSLNGSTVKDPIEYSCQRNFTILSTDGFWNETGNPTKPDGSEIGDQDSTLDRPMYDGNATGNTLADVAAYYNQTDLRTGVTGSAACKSGSGSNADVCGNSTNPAVKADEKQVMSTFTLGLGVSGYMQFTPTYLTDLTGDFYTVKVGGTPNATAGVCSWQTSGACNWPTPVSNTLTAVDDLWHAAVNGGGTYFSAANPTALYTGLSSAIKALDGQVGTAAAATASNPNVSAGDNQIFVSYFVSAEWTGDLLSERINLSTGIVDDSKPDWSARDLLDNNTSRTIYMYSSGASNKRKVFDWSTLTSSEKDYFALPWVTTSGRALTQFCTFGPYCLSTVNQALAAGQPLVNFLRGTRSNEGVLEDPSKYFRQRTHVLGDIVSSEAAYVGKPIPAYADSGYDAFKSSETVIKRPGVVYVGANDGMLHAFRADNGVELWAYVPSVALPNLYKLADKQYATQHQYFVDGLIMTQDVFTGSEWRTILVAGMGAGGRSYFALDITDPTDPKPLWEFTDNNLGLTHGKAEISKLKDGTWVVMFGSGYNNVSPGDGIGRLYVLNAMTGSVIRTISTGAGSTATPSGLTHIRGWVDYSETNNTVLRVYGGDNLGNLWRFDVNNIIGAAGYDATAIATLKSKTGVAQPITSRPELGEYGGFPLVFVGTGRYLGATDLTDASAQSIYGIKDKLEATGIGDPRAQAEAVKFIEQVLAVGSCPTGSSACTSADIIRSIPNPNTVNLAVNGGWYVDLPEARERVNTDPQLALGTLSVVSNVIDAGNICVAGGTSWVNFLDYRSGAAISTAKGAASVFLGNGTSARPVTVSTGSKRFTIFRTSGGGGGKQGPPPTEDNKCGSSGASTCSRTPPEGNESGKTRRISYRDLQQQ